MNRAPGTLVDPGALMRIKSMELRARVVVEGFWHGIHRSPYHGFSVEFSEYREYSPGDDLRYLDWKLYGRTDAYFIKRFEDETNLRVHFVMDRSRSMAFGSQGYSKSDYAATIAATIARFLFYQGDAVGLITFDSKINAHLPVRNRPGHLQRLMHALEGAPEGEGTDLGGPLLAVAELVRKRGLILLLSDMLAPLEEVERHLGLLRAGGHEIVVMQVLDPAELELDFAGATHFRDLESGVELFVDPEKAREGYREKLDAHLAAVREACGRQGLDYHLVRTDTPLDVTLYEFLSGRRNRSGGKAGRRRANVR